MSLDLYMLRRELGGQVYDAGRRWVGPGPGHSRRDASLSVRIADDDRALVHSFAGDPFRACLAHLGIESAAPESMDRSEWIRRRAERQAAERARLVADLAFASSVWSAVQPIEGTLAETYLFGRGLILEDCPVLGWLPTAPRSKRAPDSLPPPAPPHPAMVAAVQRSTGQHTGVHLTYLTPCGRKAFGDRSRLIFGPVAGGAVRLSSVGADGVLGVGEGIETSASFADRMGVPTWATLSTSGLQNFEVPAAVRKLLIAVDNDDGGAGLKAGLTLAERARRQCDVEVHPAPEGYDWNSPQVRHG